MIARVLILSLSLSFAAAPTLAIGGGPAVGGAGTSAAIGAAARDGSQNAAAGSAPPAAISRPCEEHLRRVMGRNTMRPSERREAIERCHDQPAAIDRSEIESP
jgi:hypothetical protein